MVFVLGLAAALVAGIGLVLQQYVASHAEADQPLSLHLLRTVLGSGRWWLGLGVIVLGQCLSAGALDLGSVSLVEALLSTYLLFAFATASVIGRRRITAQEIGGAALLSAALGCFIAVARPRPRPAGAVPPSTAWVLVAAALVFGVSTVLVLVARRRRGAMEAVLIATAVGVIYGLQDAGSRAALVAISDHGLRWTLTRSPWPYLVVASAAVGLLLAQSAFRAARLDYSLPPTAAAEPLVGVALGVALLGDRLNGSVPALAVEAVCVVAMIGGVAVVGRSPALSDAHDARRRRLHERSRTR